MLSGTRMHFAKLPTGFSDPIVGAVTYLTKSADIGLLGTEEGYINYYGILRLAESIAF
jgi:hypothetical protein